jgi:DNA-binding transcriptional LysR family regulator
MHNQNWEDLRFFAAVAHAGSISAAARQLGVNHSTILRRLAQLEAAMDVRLFERFQSGYQLTPAGEELHALLAPLAEQMDAAQRRVTGRNAVLSGTISVTTTDTLLHGLLVPALARFRLLHPGIQLQVAVNNSFMNLTRREADVAVRPSNTPPETLVGRRVRTIQTAVYASRDYLRRSRSAGIADQDWASHDWVAPDDSLGHLAQAKWLKANVPGERIAMRIDTLLGMAQAVRAGLGAGMLLSMLADAVPELEQLQRPDAALDTDVWVLTHADLRNVGRIKALTDFLYAGLACLPGIEAMTK